MKKTKIVCTMGPSTQNPDIIKALILNGMDVARFNFSHGDHASHRKHIHLVREVSASLNIPIAILLDTRGPEMRLGKFSAGKVELTQGQTFTLTGRDIEGNKDIVSINHKTLANEINVGDRILLSDGLVRLTVTKIDGLDIITQVENSGEMSNNKRVAVPGACLSLPFLSDKDIDDITFGINENVDFIAASFVQRAADVISIREILDKHHSTIQIISKIENAEGVKNMDEILTASDSFMIARGDLGVEIPAERVPLLQKQMIKACNQAGKPVITATQMLESMTNNPRPTRAEASDVANAILDGTDAIMLSGETASGMYPVEAVKTMYNIAKCIEPTLDPLHALSKFGYCQTITTNAICHASVQISHELNTKAILTVTESGFTARMVSKYRPFAPILAVSPYDKTLRQLQLVWGVNPVKGKRVENNTELLINDAIKQCITKKYVEKGDKIVITAGVPIGKTGTTNMIFVNTVGQND